MRIQKPTITQITELKGDGAQLTGSFSGSFSTWEGISGKPDPLLSSSAQIADDISGSLSTAHVNTKVPGLLSGSAQIADNISGSLSVSHVNTKVPGILSSSAQIATNISGAFADASASIATDIDALQGTDIEIALTGDVTGTGTITDLGNVSFVTTVTDDSHNHIIGNVDGLQDALDLKAPLDSPALTGTPTAPTATTVTNSTQLATTAFVQSRVQEVIDTAPAALDTLNELAAAINDDANFAGTVTTSLGEKLAKASNLSDLTDASAARTNLGLAIGTNVQAYNSTLAAVAGGTYSGDDSITTVGTIGTGTWQGSSISTTYTAAKVTSVNAGSGISVNTTTGAVTVTNTITNNNQLTNGAGYTTYSANQALDNSSNVHFEGLMVGQTTGATANTIRCVGDVVAYYSSDAQFKDNVETLEGALDKVKAIRGVRFDWNDKQDVYEGHDIGVIAQEVQAVYPELVHHRDHSDSLAVDYVKLTAVLIEAVKELSAKVDELSK